MDLRGLFEIPQAVVPGMAARGAGKLIHIGSINSERALGGVSVYGAAKGAIKQLTMVMAVEWADPGKRAWMEARIAQRRPGEPSELVGMAILLASRAPSYCTGQTYVVNGGFCAGGVPWWPAFDTGPHPG